MLHHAAIAAVSSALILTSTGPAAADDEVADVTAPVVTSTGLTTGQLLGFKPRFDVTVADDVAVVRVELWYERMRLVTTPTGNWTTFPFNPLLTALPNGRPLDLVIRAYDAAGNVGQATTTVVVDSVLPIVTGFTPRRGAYVPVGDLTIAATGVSDDTDHILVQERATGREIARLDGAPWTYVWPATEGAAAPMFRPVDAAGNVGIGFTPDYVVDGQSPVIKDLVSDIGPGFLPVNGRVGKGASLIPTISEAGYLSEYEWTLDGTVVSTEDRLKWTWPERATPYTLGLRVRDVVGNVGERQFSLVADTTGPAVTAVSPAAGTLIRGTGITTSVRATDPTGIWQAQLAGAAADTVAPYSTTVAAGKDGARTLVWTVYDRVGNATTVRRSVIVDNTRPALSVTKAPKNKAKVKGTVKVTAKATDKNGVARVELLVNGKVVAKDLKAGYAFSINTKKFGKKIKVQLRAYDRAGNVRVTTARTWYR